MIFERTLVSIGLVHLVCVDAMIDDSVKKDSSVKIISTIKTASTPG